MQIQKRNLKNKFQKLKEKTTEHKMLEVERDQMAHNSNTSCHDVMAVLFYTNSEFDI